MRDDLDVASAAVRQLTDQALPAWAAQLGEPPDRLREELAARHPAFGTGLTQAADIHAFTDRAVTNLERHERDAAAAESLRSYDLPLAPYVAVGAGLLVTLLALAYTARPGRATATALLAPALLLAVAPLALGLPTKLSATDRLVASLRLDDSVAARTRADLVVVQRFAADLVPVEDDLAYRLGVSRAQLDADIAAHYDALARGMTELPGILDRFDARAHIREAAVGDFADVRGTPFRALPWLAAGPALVAALAAVPGLTRS
jgi:hypothetical protein